MDPNSPEFMKTVLELRARALAENPDHQTQLKNALDPEYWRQLNPCMTVCGEKPIEANESRGVDPSAIEQALQMLFTSGYFHIPSILPDVAVEKMRRCFDITRKAGWPAGFIFVYDEFWRALRSPMLVRFLTRALGEGYCQLPYIWGIYVQASSRGWRPHVDGPSGSHKLTVWLALTDATLENGCMYVVPRNSDTKEISDRFFEDRSYHQADVQKLLHHAKALPVAAGSCVGWAANVIHWGSVSGPSASPRISVSVEFARPHPNPPEAIPPLEASPDGPLPTFGARLHMIASEIGHYERLFEAGLIASQAFAKDLYRRTQSDSVNLPH